MATGGFSGALLLLAFAVSQASAAEWNKHWSVGANPELRVRAGDAAVVIRAATSNGIDATLTTQGWTIGRNGIQVIEHQSGNNVDIEVRVPSSGNFNFGQKSIRLEVRVPRELIGDIHTGDGSISLFGLHGSLRADTGDGSIQAQDLDGKLEARTGDGSMHVSGRFDDVQLHTHDGSVELNVRPGSHLRTGWRIETGDGSIHARLPRDLAADLELRTGDGSIGVDLPGSSPLSKTAGETHGKLNGGGPPLVLRTGDGSIKISGS
jgi:DUF4097 and DUF4098 domain-containing protein YvlB